MAKYWTGLQILNQVASELGLNTASTIVGATDVQTIQFLSLLNSAGNELLLYYPWEQLHKEWVFDTEVDKGEYTLPDDWSYAIDQTQWDRTDHWPLLGPKSAQEWAWLKGGLLSVAPRLRFRIVGNLFKLWPVPSTSSSPSQYKIAQEYVVCNWVESTNEVSTPIMTDMVSKDTDIVQYDPWLASKFMKMKFYELKGFDTTNVQAEFMRIFNTLTGKDTGAPILNLSPRPLSQYLGPWSVPDGSWNVGQP